MGLFKSSYLKPDKKLLVDITTSKDSLDKALRFANDLFCGIESAGHRVTLAPRGEHLTRGKRRAQQSIKDSQEHLGHIIQQWANVERFIAGVEQRVSWRPQNIRHTKHSMAR